MIATLINALAIVVGSLIGVALRQGVKKRYETVIFSAAGLVSLVIGIQMALKTSHILALAIALIAGGLVGTWLDIEGAVLRFGEFLKRRFSHTGDAGFAAGCLTASVLFCSGAMTILGSFKAGTEGDYSLLLTKSILDGFMSILFAGAMGAGVAFSALFVVLYQGALTLLSVWLKAFVTPLMLAELSGIGGVLVIMIGINLLDLKKLTIGNFLPAIICMAILVPLMSYIPFL